jgi:hypothetical protein
MLPDIASAKAINIAAYILKIVDSFLKPAQKKCGHRD